MKLHPYQEKGALWLAERENALLADPMGLGKTAQAIVAAIQIAAKNCCEKDRCYLPGYRTAPLGSGTGTLGLQGRGTRRILR